jgi:hypothetical protein
MEYKVGFKNGMVINVEAESVEAQQDGPIYFFKGEKVDQDVYVSANNVLFIAPTERSSVKWGAVGPSTTKD